MGSLQGWIEFENELEIIEKEGYFYLKAYPNTIYSTRKEAEEEREKLKEGFFI